MPQEEKARLVFHYLSKRLRDWTFVNKGGDCYGRGSMYEPYINFSKMTLAECSRYLRTERMERF